MKNKYVKLQNIRTKREVRVLNVGKCFPPQVTFVPDNGWIYFYVPDSCEIIARNNVENIDWLIEFFKIQKKCHEEKKIWESGLSWNRIIPMIN